MNLQSIFWSLRFGSGSRDKMNLNEFEFEMKFLHKNLLYRKAAKLKVKLIHLVFSVETKPAIEGYKHLHFYDFLSSLDCL